MQAELTKITRFKLIFGKVKATWIEKERSRNFKRIFSFMQTLFKLSGLHAEPMTRHVWNNQSIIDNILELHCYCHTICKGNQTNGDTSVFVKFHVQVVYCSCPWICSYFLRVANWTVQQNLKKIYKKLKQCQIICKILCNLISASTPWEPLFGHFQLLPETFEHSYYLFAE